MIVAIIIAIVIYFLLMMLLVNWIYQLVYLTTLASYLLVQSAMSGAGNPVLAAVKLLKQLNIMQQQ